MSELERVMYVDDEPDIRAIVALALGEIGGFQVTLCASGREMIETVAALPVDRLPQLILLDVMMPQLDGPAALELMRRLPGRADVPVVFMTAKVQASERARYPALGAMGVIAKPFDPMTLADEVRALWRSRPST